MERQGIRERCQRTLYSDAPIALSYLPIPEVCDCLKFRGTILCIALERVSPQLVIEFDASGANYPQVFIGKIHMERFADFYRLVQRHSGPPQI